MNFIDLLSVLLEEVNSIGSKGNLLYEKGDLSIEEYDELGKNLFKLQDVIDKLYGKINDDILDDLYRDNQLMLEKFNSQHTGSEEINLSQEEIEFRKLTNCIDRLVISVTNLMS